MRKIEVLPQGLTIIIPVFNSSEAIPLLEKRLHSMVTTIGWPYEIIFVNDGSSDSSWEVICKLSRQHSSVHGLCMMRNYGQHNAILAGVRAARFDTLVTMDDDLQHPPEELPKLIEKYREGFDVVYGSPTKAHHGLLRDLASFITKIALSSTMGSNTACLTSAFRIFKTDLRNSFSSYDYPFVSIDVLLTWGGARFAAVAVRHDERLLGKSNYTFSKLVRHALNMMTGFSVLPLQIGSIIGFTFTLFGLCILIYVLVRYALFGTTVAGFPFLASIIAIFSGAQLFTLGIIGEYLARMHFKLMGKPAYTVRKLTETE